VPAYRFIQLDVFTSTPFEGNPLAVFPEAAGLTDELMQRIANEMNLSETVFVFPPGDAHALKRLRIFTPVRELPFAGHPVVGTWNALAREGITPKPAGGSGIIRVNQEVGIGVLPVEIEFDGGHPVRVVMTQGAFVREPVSNPTETRARIADGLGLSIEEIDSNLPIEIVSTGLRVLAVPVASLNALGRCRINSSELSETYMSVGASGVYAFTTETRDGGRSRAHARLFAPADNISEDPATGSAAGSLSGYLVYHGVVEAEQNNESCSFVIEQGDFIARRSRINAEVKGKRGSIEQVKIAGSSVIVARGELEF
jgi:trans-2,3-dihydro-3-hydroxyanthranilate isomerase